MNILKRRLTKYVAVGLVLTFVVGVALNSNLFTINSKASSVEDNESVNDGDYKEFIQQFRKDGIDITITSQEELYAEFEKYDIIDKTLRDNILAATSDEVLISFIRSENKKFMEINNQSPDQSVFSDNLEEMVKEKYSDFITKVNTTYYERGEDSYKKVTTLTNKYGGETKITCIDEPEGYMVTRKETVVKEYNNSMYKDYGSRAFIFQYEPCVGAKIEVILGYTLKYGCITAEYVKAHAKSVLSPSARFDFEDKDITKKVANNIGDSVSGYATFKYTAGGVAFGGFEVCHYDFRMSVKKGADSNSTWKCGMMIEHHGKVVQVL